MHKHNEVRVKPVGEQRLLRISPTLTGLAFSLIISLEVARVLDEFRRILDNKPHATHVFPRDSQHNKFHTQEKIT
jgi:hypothetical protein